MGCILNVACSAGRWSSFTAFYLSHNLLKFFVFWIFKFLNLTLNLSFRFLNFSRSRFKFLFLFLFVSLEDFRLEGIAMYYMYGCRIQIRSISISSIALCKRQRCGHLLLQPCTSCRRPNRILHGRTNYVFFAWRRKNI